jgi:hypothetical protein
MKLFLKFKDGNKIVTSIKTYVLALLLTSGRKTCANMARTTNISSLALYSFMRHADHTIPVMRDILIEEAKKLLAHDDPVDLAIDFSQQVKNYAQKIEKLGYDHNGCSNRTEKGLSIGFTALISKKRCIPFDLNFWVQKKYAEGAYIKKTDLAIQMLKAAADQNIKYRYALLDGAFACLAIIEVFEKLKQEYFMRIPSNRVIEVNGFKAKIKDQPELKLMRNLKAKTVAATYKGIACFITAEKRKKRDGTYEVVYIISNVTLATPQEYIEAYANRGQVEKFFRTGKQSLGTAQCQMLSHKKQEAHILSSIIGYVILEENKIDNQKDCPEDIINEVRKSDLRHQHVDLLKKRSSISEFLQKNNRACADSAIGSIY